ncbi:fibrillin-1-like isoform X3 [Acropora muricata]|uniref:fibrillin-1-like isoform X3 n=1 Tax=Acropora muricata TaxID=159855 RepID=UPI0034E556ED
MELNIKWMLIFLPFLTNTKVSQGYDGCTNHQVLNDRSRAAGVSRGNILKCDQKDLVTPKWYRFTGAAGIMMPTSCVPKHYCGTHAPGWVSGSHPRSVGNVVNAKVCFHWGSNCCNWNTNIKIKKCNGFYVYQLARTPVCWLRYCGNGGFDPCKASKPCKNNATCANSNGDYRCICKPGYQGKNCERDINECVSRPCRNGGTCVNLPGSYKCNCRAGYVGKRCEIVFDACRNYVSLSDRERAAGVPRGNTLKCDQKDLDVKWYRFLGAAGTQMPTSCVPKHHCGTHAPGWLAGSRPTRLGQVVNARVCFHWGSNCCNWNANIQIKRCNGFYVYKLVKTPVCWLRYCGNAGFDPCKASKPCKNNATCANSNGDYRCICKPGYQGKNCERDINECVSRPCRNGGTCVNLPGSYKCNCRAGYVGKRCEIVFDACRNYVSLSDRERAAGVPRGNTLKCDQKDLDVKWYRFLGAAGTQMPTSCVPKHHCGTHAPGWLAGSRPTRLGQVVNARVCFHWGSNCCNWNANIQIKRCNGFYVYKLVKTPVCWLRYCGNAGFDPCKASKPCKNNATCANSNGDYRCICKPGYQGKNCERDINECVSRPCRNGGTCVNLPGSYKCNCRAGYVGKRCEIVFDACRNYVSLSDRERAAGVPRGNTLKCDQKDLDVKWYRFLGAAGTQMPTSCVPKHHCGTHAPGWLAGSRPTRLGQVVNARVCFHWGSNCCNWNANIQIKRCNGFYVYKLVKTPVCWLRYCGNAGFDPCKASKPCKNNATCANSNGDYRCICKPGYQGKNCERDINECVSRPCRNGGTCVNLPGSYKCNCRAGYVGKRCEIVFDACRNYVSLSDRERAAGVPRGNTLKCDQKDLDVKWYRFLGAAGTQMPTSCVPKHHCGTHAPGWLAGSRPTRLGQVVNARVCFHWGSNCCNWNANIQIKRCNGFYVYKLVKTPVCWLRYCGNAGFDPCKASKPCKNNATCANSNGDYRCICKPGYQGKNCERDINECVSRPCRNGGTCVNLPGSYKCNCRAGYVGKRCEIVFDACRNYVSLSDRERAAGVPRGNTLKCDQKDLDVKWYRFLGAAGTQMPTSCVPKHHCGTHAPGWLAGSRPTRRGQVVNARVCFHWGSNCCNWNANIQIKRCNGFYVYKLVKTPVCWLRYCGNAGFDPCKASKPCKNNATCANSNGDYRCICKPGYQGKNCERDINECVSRPCRNGGTCVNLPGSYKCNCRAGYVGKRCEIVFDACRNYVSLSDRERAAGVPRGNTLKCDQKDLDVKWYRFLGAAGTQMPTSCVPKHHCGTHAPGWLAGSRPTRLGQVVNARVCFHWGSNCCNWNANIQIKRCNGFYVYKLVKTPVCWLRYCGNAGFDPCKASKPCKNNATCANSNGDYRCICKPGYQGKNCERDINECVSRPCRNGGTCVNLPGSYKCNCRAGYVGKRCEIVFDACRNYVSLSDRERAAGVPRGNTLKCDQKDLDVKWYRFLGAAGTQMPTSCVPKHHCGTHAPGWLAGSRPTRLGQVVNARVCFHWGSNCCNWNANIQIKRCNGFYVYKLVKTPVCWLRYCGNAGFDPCKASKPCKNNATCANSNGDYRCICKPGYQGKNCERDINECVSRPCRNGGTCVNLPGSYKCNCRAGYVGKRCEIVFDACRNYVSLSDRERAAGVPRGNTLKCDQKDLDVKWYRFLGAAGTQMPTSCVPKHHCGTHAPGWLAGSRPTRLGQVVNARVCFHWGSNCCNWNANIQIKRCNGFYVYKLVKTPVCWLRYCGNAGFDPCKASKPCKNNATCANSNGNYRCICKPGYQGKNCERDINECVSRPCRNGGTCVNLPGSYKCNCRAGYVGKRCEIVFDACRNYVSLSDRERAAGVPRGNTLKCDQKDLDVKWYRFLGAAGTQMPTSCVPKHHCGTHAPGWLAGSRPTRLGQVVNARVCFHWGSNCCNWNANIQIKRCNGFYVYKLVKTPVCWLRYCGNAGFDPCKASKPCKNNATCANSNGNYRCICKPGYQGKNCERDINECVSRPCRNGGTCVNLPGSYKCNCRAGYVGKRCEIVFDACRNYVSLSDRERAAGVPRGNTLKCDQKDLDVKWYRFLGAAGTQMPTSCVPKHHCGTHAPGWLTGSRPTRLGQVVNARVCFHWGSNCCNWNANIQIKRCNGFYVYKLVKTPVCWLRYCGNAGFDPCKASKPCKNNATCANSNGDYRCICKPGYQGKNCERDINECVSRPCRNGGTCVNLPGSYKCNCRAGYVGKRCEIVFDACRNYVSLSDRERAAGVPRGNTLKCDQKDLDVKWYRFLGAAGTQMPTSCVPKHHCGTHAPGWLAGSRPTRLGQVVNARVCFHWGSNCCNWNANIQIKRCNGFYVYKLVKTPVCWLRYCGNAGFDPCKASKPCKNNATCVNNNGDYRCICKPGYQGKNCDQDVNECLSRPCLNGGSCHNLIGSYSCTCKPGFTGKRCEKAIDGCVVYKVLNEKNRAAGYNGSLSNCDQGALITPAWYRFSGDAGVKLADSCVQKSHCGTHAPGWFNGSLPSNVGETVVGTVCFHWSSSCCEWSVKIRVKKCNGSYYVYELQRTPVCHLRYCGNSGLAINECAISKPCKNNATCFDLVNGYRCQCRSGFQGKNCDTDINECITNNPCKNGATCENSFGGYTCRCVIGFKGQNCDQDVNECMYSPCQNGGSCVNFNGGYRCNCVQGYDGRHCDQDINECLTNNPCQNGSTCVNNNGGYQCLCVPGLTGLHCDQDINECTTSNPCKNGSTCVNKIGGYQCLCVPGYFGIHCDKDVDECFPIGPCKNGGNCVNKPGSYECQCLGGYQGQHCEHDINECLTNNPCKNASTCVNSIGGYLCLCVPGLTGVHCDQDVDECNPISPCQNGGSCVNKPGSYQCQCLSGFQGNDCENDVDECSLSPCQNGGTCNNTLGGYACECYIGFQGKNCENDVDECKSSPCRNGSTCVNVNGSFRCDCEVGFTGRLCNQDIDECHNNPCNNSVSCTNSVGGYTCNCIGGFEGKNCEVDINECKLNNTCLNGGICQNKYGSYKCNCVNGYTGSKCEKKKSFTPLGCFNDAPNDRALEFFLKNFRGSVDWSDMSKTIKKCADVATSHTTRLRYFALQYYGECWGGTDNALYKKHGKAPDNKCWSGVGGSLTNFVYELP